MNRKEIFVSIVAPLHNNADILETFTHEVTEILSARYTNYEIVYVDDGSSDATQAVVRNVLSKYPSVRYIRLSREFGRATAITVGLNTVIGDYTVVMQPNDDPPHEIPDLIERCINGCDFMYGVRDNTDKSSLLERFLRSIFHRYCKSFLKIDFPKNATQFLCLSRQSLNAITQTRDSYRLLQLFSSYVGYEKQPFVYTQIDRRSFKIKKSIFKSIGEAISIVVENSNHPLRLVSWLALFTAACNLIYVGYIFMIYILKDTVAEGWTTLSLQNAVQFFLISLILTIFSEYLGRILNKLDDRPHFFVSEEINSFVDPKDTNEINVVQCSESLVTGKHTNE